MAQTPQQRAANAKFARREEAKMGKPVAPVVVKRDFKSPISKGWISTFDFPLLLLEQSCADRSGR
ncbi:hypothetical protein K504DRAFT_466694 [Pleomassaria siparia CBS 279.74]|uniref:Stress-associated endoplasmic reticulum protein n=1 Tax=Pleomassaria siparia CBS 279.74 TaxID=1314801 RepID=A0A6G1KCW5_9PLEO|nr:hypothetical protein K504DRAFT_466694 [Pleomassaria siparia CBS 279.74]